MKNLSFAITLASIFVSTTIHDHSLAADNSLVNDNIQMSKRRECIDGGNVWVSNKSGSYCLRKINANARDQNMINKFDGFGIMTDSVAMGPRRRCVRNGGTFYENNKGYMCTYAKGATP